MMHIRLRRAVAYIALSVSLGAVVASAQNSSSENTEAFSMEVAERLMLQVRDGLVSQNPDEVLAAFDPDSTPNYNTLAGQVTSFFATWESIRVHYSITQVNAVPCATACGAGTVQFQMEADNVDSGLPPMRRGAQLRIRFQLGSKGWKIVNLTPRDLFR